MNWRCFAVVGAGEAVLAGLAHSVGHAHAHADVLTGQRGLDQAVVDSLDNEGHDVGGLLDLSLDLPVAPDRLGPDAAGAVEPAFLIDQCVGHQPIDLVPRGGDLRGDRIAQYVDDRPHEVVVHHLVLVGADAQGSVFVRDPREQVLRHPLRGLDQAAGESGHRSGQRLLLLATGLVAAIEGAVKQLWMLGEHMAIKALGNLADVLTDHR